MGELIKVARLGEMPPGTVVTCPWHGAQFDVTTGQVVGPPAGQSVPAYTVVVHGDDIQVDVSEGGT